MLMYFFSFEKVKKIKKKKRDFKKLYIKTKNEFINSS